MKLKLERRSVPAYISEVQFGVEKDLERIVGTYDGPEGNARVEIVWAPATREYYKLEISTNAPPGFYEVLRTYFGVDAQTSVPASAPTPIVSPSQYPLPSAPAQGALPGQTSPPVFERPPDRKLLK